MAAGAPLLLRAAADGRAEPVPSSSGAPGRAPGGQRTSAAVQRSGGSPQP
ncbi:hypothetical protein NKH18_29935 [Streptomyces sp. M10(2022)]